MAFLTPKQWADRMTAKFNEFDKAIVLSIQDTIAETTTRIFDKGLNSANGVIGVYSRKPIYINPKTGSPKTFATNGKRGGSVFKNGKAHQTRYFKGGYREFKGFIGKGTRVNLELFGELKGDASSVKLIKINGGYAWTLKKNINAEKVERLETIFGNAIFNLTRGERKNYKDVLRFELLKKLNG